MTIYEKIQRCTFIDMDEYSDHYGEEYLETKKGTRYYYSVSLENSNDPDEWKVYAAEEMGDKMKWLYLKSLKEHDDYAEIMRDEIVDIEIDEGGDENCNPIIRTKIRLENGFTICIEDECPSGWYNKSVVWQNDYKKMIYDQIIGNIYAICKANTDSYIDYIKENI